MNRDQVTDDIGVDIGSDFWVELGAWLILGAITCFFCWWALSPSEAAAKIVPAPAPLPVLTITFSARLAVPATDAAEAPVLTGDLASPGLYAVNHSTTNAP